MIGQTIAHYRILAELGKGGMGIVYEAEDTRLKRRVALKVLPAHLADDPQRLERFQREAEAVAALNHPNIVTVYSVEEAEGIHFITMEMVRGHNLDQVIPTGGVDLETFFSFSLLLAEALSTAHAQGIIHRDLKPANIMIGEGGQVKILDFGLAKLQQTDTPVEMTRVLDEKLTGEGHIVGTVPYMSPEQLQGKEIDPRSDLFSLGIIMYELATGERPFQGESSADLMSSILKDAPTPVTDLKEDLPKHLSRIIAGCLEKNPDHRHQTAKGLRNSLRNLQHELQSESIIRSRSEISRPTRPRSWRIPVLIAGAAAALVVGILAVQQLRHREGSFQQPDEETPALSQAESPRKMIVVLPFENLGSPEDEYFADGITEEITSRLAALKGLGVISRTSALQYKETRPTLKQIGEELGVDYVLEGTVRWERRADGPSRIRVTPQLIRVEDDTHLWASRYDGKLEDIFAVQTNIAKEVARELNVALLEPELRAIHSQPTENMEAYQAYLRAMDIWNRPGYERQRFELAAQMFERALELDPDFVLAHAELANVYDMLYLVGDATEEVLVKAEESLRKATALDPDLPQVRIAQGYHYYLGYFDYDRALVEFQAAAAVLPNNPDILEGVGYIRRRQGRLDESIAQLQQALQLDPQNAHLCLELGKTYEGLRRNEMADHLFDRAIALTPDENELYQRKAENLLDWRGSTEETRAVLARAPNQDAPEIALGWVHLDLMDRNYQAALDRISALHLETMKSWRDKAFYYVLQGLCHRFLRQTELARLSFEAGHDLTTRLVKQTPQRGRIHSFIGFFAAMLGWQEEALREANLAVELAANDRFFGPFMQEIRARINAQVGEHAAAIDQLEQLLITPYFNPISVNRLRLDPAWDPLRKDSRFQRLLAAHDGAGS